MTLQEYIKNKGRGSIATLAKLVGVKTPIAFYWVKGQRQAPAERCPAIERITEGKVTCEELRPDVDWAVLRNSKKGK